MNHSGGGTPKSIHELADHTAAAIASVEAGHDESSTPRNAVFVHSRTGHQCLASRNGVERPSASAPDRQHKQAAGHREILLEVQQLVPVRMIGVEEEGSRQTEQGEAKSAETCLEAECQHQARDKLEWDRWQKHETGNADFGHIGGGGREAADQRDAFMQKDQGEQQAAGQQ